MKTVSLTLILSVEDYNTLLEESNEVGLKKSEYLRTIIQGIGAVSAVSNKNNNVGYGFGIPNNVKKELLENIAQKLKLGTKGLGLNNKNLRHKRMKLIQP